LSEDKLAKEVKRATTLINAASVGIRDE
jgi:hypothetical protein